MRIALKILILVLMFSLSACNLKEKKDVGSTEVKPAVTNLKQNNNSNDVVAKKEDSNLTEKTNQSKTTELSDYDKYMQKAIHLKNKIISSTLVDYDKDKKKEEVQIILEKGYFHEDNELWAGKGPKWVGSFSIHVLKDGKSVFSTSLNKLLNSDSSDDIFFYSPEFKLKLCDYNSDGKFDFVLSQYFSSNGCEYFPLTIENTGEIKTLKIEGKYAFFISPPSTENSILLERKNNKIATWYYDNTEGFYFTDYYGWNTKKQEFILEKQDKTK